MAADSKNNDTTEKGSIFAEISSLAVEHGAVNLGQGFPDFGPPQHVLDALKHVATNNDPSLHQYCRSFGHVRLVEAVSKLYSRLYDRVLDPLKNILIPFGAYGGLVCVIESVVKPGDEILVFEPFVYCYVDMIKVAGATPVFIPLKQTQSSDIHQHFTSDTWTFNEEYLLSHIGPNTKAILINTPSNPLGKVFSEAELEIIRDMCIEFDLICISDEAYEWMTFDGRRHVKIGAMNGMWERTLTIGSAEKTFSVTDWKLDWVIGPDDLIRNCQAIFQKCYSRCPTPIQEAVAIAMETEVQNFESEHCYLKTLAKVLEQKRDWIVNRLTEIGITPVIPGGGYFLIADISTFKKNSSLSSEFLEQEADDIKISKWIIKEKKVFVIPVSLFYSTDRKEFGQKFIRVCFAKEHNTLEVAMDKLKE